MSDHLQLELKRSTIFCSIRSNPIFFTMIDFFNPINSILMILKNRVYQSLGGWTAHLLISLRTTDLCNEEADIMSCGLKFSALFIFLEQVLGIVSIQLASSIIQWFSDQFFLHSIQSNSIQFRFDPPSRYPDSFISDQQVLCKTPFHFM